RWLRCGCARGFRGQGSPQGGTGPSPRPAAEPPLLALMYVEYTPLRLGAFWAPRGRPLGTIGAPRQRWLAAFFNSLLVVDHHSRQRWVISSVWLAFSMQSIAPRLTNRP